MSTRVTVLQALKLALTALIIGLLPNPLHAGDKTYIEVEIDGETVGKWMEFCEHSEYNPDGKEVYWKKAGFDGTVTECWYEYDRNGNRIHTKYSNGDETWYEYDRNGNCIHKKSSGGDEWWYEYDRNGKLIHTKDSDGWEKWYEYDRNGNRIYEKDCDGEETWYEYDRNGNCIHQKYSDGSKRWYEYDTYGNMIREIWKSKGGEINEITVYILEYYRDSATVKTKTAYYYEQ